MTSQYTARICGRKPGFDFVAAHFNGERNPYTTQNPDGYVNLGSAQNFLNKREICARLSGTKHRGSDASYQAFVGTDNCRQAVANYLQSVAGVTVEHDQIVLGNGVIGLLEALAISLLDIHQTVLIPSPVFPGLVNAITARQSRQVRFLELGPETNFRLTPQAFKAELVKRFDNGEPIKAALLCSPGNPVGQVFSAEEIAEFVQVAAHFGIALIVDEIYASSCFGPQKFASAIAAQAEHVFVVGGLSKDFGVAGLATGWVYGQDTSVMRAVASQSHFFRLPAPVQTSIESLLEPGWRAEFLQQNRQRLQQSFQRSVSALEEMNVPVFRADAGLCLWLDLSQFIGSPDAHSEQRLYEFLLNEHRVHVSPGSGFFSSTAGFFRICVAQEETILQEGLRRLANGLSAISLHNKPATIHQSSLIV